MNNWQRALNWFKNLKTPKWLKELKNSLWEMVKEIIAGSTEILLARIKNIAIEACLKVENDPSIITNEDKRKKAFEEISMRAKATGLEVRDSLISLALELAVNFLKKGVS